MKFISKELRRFINWEDYFGAKGTITLDEYQEYIHDIHDYQRRDILLKCKFTPEQFIEFFTIFQNFRITQSVLVKQEWFSDIPEEVYMFFTLHNFKPKLYSTEFLEGRDGDITREFYLDYSEYFPVEAVFLGGSFYIRAMKLEFSSNENDRFVNVLLNINFETSFADTSIDVKFGLYNEKDRNYQFDMNTTLLKASVDNLEKIAHEGMNALISGEPDETFHLIVEKQLKERVENLINWRTEELQDLKHAKKEYSKKGGKKKNATGI